MRNTMSHPCGRRIKLAGLIAALSFCLVVIPRSGGAAQDAPGPRSPAVSIAQVSPNFAIDPYGRVIDVTFVQEVTVTAPWDRFRFDINVVRPLARDAGAFLGDLTGDGHPDLLMPSFTGETLFFPGLAGQPARFGAGTYLRHTQATPAENAFNFGGANWHQGDIGDLDGDGVKDVVIGDVLYRNVGTGSEPVLDPVYAFTGGGFFDPSASIGDLNGDLKPDVVITWNYASGNSHIYWNNSTPGNFSFTRQALNNPNSSSSQHLALGDINGDGLLDLVCPEGVYLNSGTPLVPSFNFVLSAWNKTGGPGWLADSDQPSHVVLRDGDGDGLLDAYVSDLSTTLFQVLFYKNVGTATAHSLMYVSPIVCDAGPTDVYYHGETTPSWSGSRAHAATGDVDNNGFPDLLLTPGQSSATILWNNTAAGGSQTLGYQDLYTYPSLDRISASCGGTPDSACSLPNVFAGWKDVTGDGAADALQLNQGANFSLYKRVRSGTLPFTLGPAIAVNTTSGPQAAAFGIAWVDIDLDSRIDLIGGDEDGHLRWYRNLATDGSFVAADPVLLADVSSTPIDVGRQSWVAAIDLDGDSDLDFLVSNYDGNVFEVFCVTPGSSQGYALGPQLGTPQQDPLDLSNVVGGGLIAPTITTIDVNGDGKADIVAGDPSGRLWLLRNVATTGTAIFVLEPLVISRTQAAYLEVLDPHTVRLRFAVPAAIGSRIGFHDVLTTGGPVSGEATILSPTLGNYADTSVQLGANTTVTPDAVPISAASLGVSTSSAFKGTLTANSATGVVYVTNAQPAGIYLVTVTAFNSAGTRTFTLTVNNPTPCDSLHFSAASGSPFTVGSLPTFEAVGDFNGDGKQDLAIANWGANNLTVLLGNGSGGFSVAGPAIAVGSNPVSVAVGDFNVDGRQDLAIARSRLFDNLTVLLGNGSGGFSAASGSPFSAGQSPESVAVGDFNGDGKPDLATANWGSNNVTVLLGNGGGGFSPASGSPFAAGTNPTSVAVGDFNGDGKPDLTVANRYSDNVTVLLGNGSGSFSAASGSPFTAVANPASVAVGDFNSDGNLDLTTANQGSSNVTVLLGDGSGGFSPATGSPFAIGSSPLSVVCGDLNGDGKLDLITANIDANNATVLLGNGSGGFSAAAGSPFPVGSDPYLVVVGDFNGDGKLDLTSVNDGSNNVTVLLNTCTSNTAPTISAVGVTRQQGSPSANATIANVNDLEDLETSLTMRVNGGASATVNGVTVSAISVSSAGVVTANVIADCTATTATFTLRVTDTGALFNEATLTVTVNPNTAPTLSYLSPQSVVFGGALNVTPTSASDNGTITGYAVQAGHGLTTAPTVDSSGVVSITNAQPAGSHTITIRATDNCGVTTDAAFTLEVQPQPPTLGTYPNTTVALGANATVTPDAAPTNATSINVSSSTNFKGSFAASPATGVVRVTNAHPAGAYTVTVKAFNGSASVTRSFTLTVQTGTPCTGVSLFTNAGDMSVGPGSRSVAIGDFNGDGKQDFAVIASGTALIRLGDGTGGFTATTTVSVGINPDSVAVGDFNGDGRQDIAVANWTSNTVSIRLGNGDGTFTGTTEVSVGTNPSSVVIGDFNNDGKQDIAVVTGSWTVSIRLGDGLGGFSGTTNVSVGVTPYSVAIGDFNNDGKQDFATANYGGNSVSIRLGDGLGGFSGTTNVSVGELPDSVAIGDFNNDGRQDIAASNNASGTVSIRLGNGDATFTGSTNVSVGANPWSVAIGDFNNDGKQDIAAPSYSSNAVSIRLGDGSGGFSGTTNVGVGSQPGSVVIGDFNNDGKQDIATANESSSNVSIRLGACNPAPTIAAATGLSRQQASPASNSQIATVTDDGGNGSVSVTVTSTNPSNGVTISNIVNTGGNITADIVAGCTATNASFTLQASDLSSTATDTLTVTVTANTAPALVYASPQAVVFGGALNVTPTSASDNGTITGYAVQAGHGLTAPPTVDASGVVSITNAQPPGAHTITIRATDNCGAFTDAAFTLNVGAMPTFAIDDVTQAETNSGATSFVFTVTKSGSTALNSSVNFTTVDGAATTANNDYQTSAGSLTFLPADSIKQIAVFVNGDTTFEPNEAFTVHLSGASGATISDADGAGTIVNDDSFPTFSIDDVTHNEGNSSTTAFIFTVTKTGSTALNCSVNFTTADGAATAASGDYQFNSDALTFSPAEMTKTITVLVNGDTTVEPDETFTVHLFAASGATIADADGTGTITNDDVAAPTLGNYPNTTVQAGANTTMTPDAAPTSTTSMNVSTSSAFKGTFAASPTTGVVQVTDAQPAGTYTVTVRAFNSAGVTTTKTFTLTVNNPAQCVNTTFSSGSPFDVGAYPYSVAVGDFNGDGKQDLATANYSSNDVTVLLGNGSGGFSAASASPFAVGTNPISVAVGDFNADGKQDLAIANSGSNNVTVLLGNGSGGFAPASGSPFAVGTNPFRVAVGDFNGDGKLDLVTANRLSNNATVLLGDGSGGFSPASGSPFTVGTDPRCVAVGDFNGDGKLDFTTSNFNSYNLTVLLGNGAGGFSEASGSPVALPGADAYSVAVGDANNDGKLDLMTANVNLNNTMVLLGNGSGGFSPAPGSPFNVGTNPFSVTMGDFNGDGSQDLATANYWSHNLTVLLGNGSGSFSPAAGSPVAVSLNPISVVVGDFNADGRLDLATANNGSSSVMVLLNTCAANSSPTISAVGVTRQQGSPSANSTIANVNDLEDPETALTVTVNGGASATVNGVTVSAISVDAAGVVTADVIASCTATTATFTLRVTDTGALFNEATLTVTVNPNIAPTLTYSSPQAVVFGGALNATPTAASDNGAVTYSVQAGHGLTPPPTVDATGVVSITNAQPSGAHTITIRATDNCGAFTDAAFALNVGAMPAFAIDDVTHNEGDVGTLSYTFTVTKTGSTALNSAVNFTTVDGSATTAGNDYQLNTGALNFLPADTTKQITVLVICDTAVEPDEAFTVHLSGPSGATISDPDGTGAIINDDCSFSLSNNSENFSAPGGTNSVNVITATGCTWVAVSNNAFIMVTSGSPGSGNGTVNYSVVANTGPARTGTMTIAGITFTVTQDSGCTLTLTRDHESFPGNGGNGTVNVTASDAGCAWTASTTSIFVTITSGGSGTGNGAVQYSVAANAGSTIRSDTITIAGHSFTVYQGINFLDVPSSNPFYDDIGKLAARGVTVGCGSGNYCPNDPVLRQQMAAFILRAMGEFDPLTPGSQRFTDVPPENVFYNFIDRLAVLQITLGCTPDHLMYCPTAPVVREQMAAFILRGLGEFDPPTPAGQRFNDVPNTNLFYNFIDRMAVLNITLGCQASPPLYCPGDSVTRSQMAAFLVRAFNL